MLLWLACGLAACNPVRPDSPPVERFAGKTGKIRIEILGFRNDSGQALISIFNTEAGFPDETEHAAENLAAPIVARRVFLTSSPLPYGDYGISVLHDENGNGVMDRSLIGFPTEGFGFSGKPSLTFGRPSFREVRFLLTRDPHDLTVTVTYETVGRNKSQAGSPPR